MITQNYKLNIIPKIERSVRGITPPPTVNVSQYDKGLRTLVFDLYDGANGRLTIQEGQTAKLYGKKPDANVFEYDMTIGEDMRSVSIVLQEQMAVVAGCVKCEVRIFDGTSTVGSANFILAVEKAPVGADEAYSESELPEIDNLLYGGEVGQVFTKTRTGARWALIGTDSGLMMKSEYDPNDTGSVLKADHADDAGTVDGHTVARNVLADEYTNEQIDSMMQAAGTVKTVNSVQPDQNGNVQISKADIGLGNVDNTSDADKPISTAAQAALDQKVDKVTGKGLSTNDYTDADKTKLGDLPTDAELTAELAGKVDKESGKGLSTNDYTTADKEKLQGIETGAQVNTVTGVKGDSETTYRTGNINITKNNIGLGNVDNTADLDKPVSTAMRTALDGKVDKVPGKQLSTEDFTTAEKTKLAGIEAGAQVNTITGVKGDAEATYRTGDVNITKANIGLGNVDNISDLDKPISTAMQTALDQKMTKSVYDSNGNGVVDNAEKVDGHTVARDVLADEYTNEQIDEMHGTMLDSTFAAMLDMTNTTSIFKAWYAQASKDESDRYALFERFADMMVSACGDITFTLRNYLPSVSSDSAMTPMDDLAQYSAGQLCTENTVAVPDWTDEHPIGGWYIRANALSLHNGNMNVLAIEGVDEEFDETGELAPVYCFCMSPWIKKWSDENYEYISFRGQQDASESYRPMAEAVDFVDNSKRNLTWHPAYGGGENASGGLTSGSGKPAWNFQSANAGITNARKVTAFEGLWNDCDTDFILTMWQLRHFNLENSGIAEGCTNYNYQYNAAVAETGVKRVLITTAQAANLVAGSTVSVGEMGTNTDKGRGNGYMRNLADSVKILSIENVDVDGTTYAAVNVDAPTTFDTTTTTVISTWPWIAGATDALPGHKDGCFHSLTAGKGPLRVMGIEILNGAYVNGLDPLWNVVNGEYQIYTCRDSEKQAGSITADYEKVLTQPSLVTSSSWQYIKHLINNVFGVVFPDAVGGSSTTYFKSAFYWWYSTGVRSPWRFCHLTDGGIAGLAGANGSDNPGNAYWHGVPRLSGSGKKRGEWSA